MATHRYSEQFFDFVDISSGRSARGFVNCLNLGFEVGSVLDVGCARGLWLDAWIKRGATDVFGLDSADVDPADLVIPATKFRALDISKPFSLGRKFDLVQCLEVCEHLPQASAATVVKSLVEHADIVLFSAATPGQGGEFHVNEQPLEYWSALFAECGYRAFDYPRVAVQNARDVEPWYRYNTVLYASTTGIQRLCSEVTQCAVPTGARFTRRASIGWRLRCYLLRALPQRAVLLLAQFKHRLVLALKT
jgi:SAM-dependent methyltransferase